MQHFTFRSLRGYSLDPGFSTRLDTLGVNEYIYRIRWEKVKKGPVGEYFEVIDYDPASNCYYDPVDLNSVEVLAQNGLPVSEGNPKFHQQFVYTIAMQTLEHFEQSLGRKVIWSPRRHMEEGQLKKDYVPKLRLYPHGFRGANAYYSPDEKAILFGYFEAAHTAGGSNIPGGTIFTCLSPDIIAHELTHALLESIHPRFSENTNVDVPAFHEAFADIVALLQRFTISPLVEHQIARTRGNLGEFSFLGELATQFGDALGQGRGALRSAIGKLDKKGRWMRMKPDPTAYNSIFEPHHRGGILVAVFFDALLRVYELKTADLIRIATNGSGILQPGAIHPDLVKRLAAEAGEIARHMLHISIRALDYCPPLDINFGDYLRALITADLDTAPLDENGYRIALIEAFRSWGIFPERARTLSIESLAWRGAGDLSMYEKSVLKEIARMIKKHVRVMVDLSSLDLVDRKKIYDESQKLQERVYGMLMREKTNGEAKAWAGFLRKLGLTNEPVTFTYEGEKISSGIVPPIEVHKVRPVYRVGREDRLVEQVIITLTQTFRVSDGSLAGAQFRGGCSMILNMSKNYDVEYIIYRNITSEERFRAQLDYQLQKTSASAALTESLYLDGDGFDTINFAHLHFHDMI